MKEQVSVKALMEERWRRKGVACPFWPTCWKHIKTKNELANITYVSIKQALNEALRDG